MIDFNSKYTGVEVETFLDQVSEMDSTYTWYWDTSHSGTITEEELNKLETSNSIYIKVVVNDSELTYYVDSKGKNENVLLLTTHLLSSEINDGGESIPNVQYITFEFDKTNKIWSIQGANIDLATYEMLSTKQDLISDLEEIRSGANKGATALQSIPSEYVTESELSSKGYATTVALNDKVDKVSGKQLSTEDFTTALKTKLESLSNYNDTEINNAITSLQTQLNTLVSGNANDAINSFNEIIAFLDGVKDTQDLAGIIASIEQQIASKMDKVTLATVATSGSYNDLTNKPTIPSAVTESTVSGWGFTKNLGTITEIKMNGVSKGTSGVVDLGTVITSHQDISGKQDKLVSGTNIKTINNTSILGSGNISITGGSGTITGVSANGTSIATSGVANIPAATTSKYGVTQLSSSTSSTSTSLAATPSAVKAAYDLANGKQDKLVSGTNIKTINGTSILGSGNITISGGSSSGGSGAYPQVNHGTSDTTFALTSNTFHVWDEVASLTLTLGSETSGVANEFLFQFTSGATATSLTLPDDIKWVNDSAPTIAENKIYQISVLNGLAIVLEFNNEVKILENFIDISEGILNFTYPTNSELVVDVYGRTTGMPSSHTFTIPLGASSFSTGLTTILYINRVTPSSDSKYNYTYMMS